jgi:hypothetical protein
MEPTTVGLAADDRRRPLAPPQGLMPRRDSKRGSHDDKSRRPTLNVGLFLSHVVRFRSITGQRAPPTSNPRSLPAAVTQAPAIAKTERYAGLEMALCAARQAPI